MPPKKHIKTNSRPNRAVWTVFVNCAHWRGSTLAIYKTVLIIFPLNLQTITITLEVVKWRWGGQNVKKWGNSCKSCWDYKNDWLLGAGTHCKPVKCLQLLAFFKRVTLAHMIQVSNRWQKKVRSQSPRTTHTWVHCIMEVHWWWAIQFSHPQTIQKIWLTDWSFQHK